MESLQPDLDTLEAAMRLFFQTMKRPHNWARTQRRSGVTIDRPSAVILQSLRIASGPSRVQDLADKLGIEAPSVSRKAQELEQAGYLRRLPDKHDKRAIDLHITARGRATADKIRKAQRDMIGEVLADWQPAERRKFVKMFERFSASLAGGPSEKIKNVSTEKTRG